MLRRTLAALAVLLLSAAAVGAQTYLPQQGITAVTLADGSTWSLQANGREGAIGWGVNIAAGYQRAFAGASRAEDQTRISAVAGREGVQGFAQAWARERGLSSAADAMAAFAAPRPLRTGNSSNLEAEHAEV